MSKSPSLRRIQADIRELALDPSDRYHAAPLENDMFEWHFTIRGAEGTEFEGGIYHGRILLPPEYPFKPPHIIFLTSSGRFEVGTKVCLSFSAFHPELWQPAWGIRLILEALISFLPTPADGAIGALDWKKEERQRLAKLSQSYCCTTCGKCSGLLPELKKGGNDEKKPATTRFAKEIAELQRLQQLADKKKTIAAAADEIETTSNANGAKEESTDGSSSSAAGIATATSAESINQEAPEEEIVFDDDDSSPSPMDNATASMAVTESLEEEPKEQNAAAENTMPDVEAHNNAMPLLENDPSWMYDPLLNLMMVLLAVICYLLVQKYQDLMGELYELRQMSDLSK